VYLHFFPKIPRKFSLHFAYCVANCKAVTLLACFLKSICKNKIFEPNFTSVARVVPEIIEVEDIGRTHFRDAVSGICGVQNGSLVNEICLKKLLD
jgi:hypothetical protein